MTAFDHTFHLLDLPTAHHRAGLAALQLLVQWLPPFEGVLSTELVDGGLRVQFDEQGLGGLLTAMYRGTMIEIASKSPLDRPALRQEVRDGKTFSIYTMVVPHGAFLGDLDPSEGKKFLKLWRDMMFGSLRTVKGARLPFERTERGDDPLDISKAYKILLTKRNDPQPMSGSWMLGCRERTGDGIPVREKAITQFLLHFWPLVATVMVHRTYNVLKAATQTAGLYIGIPNVADLHAFCRKFPARMRARDTFAKGLFPEAVIADVEEDLLLPFLSAEEDPDIFGMDVFHCERTGQTVHFHSISRVDLPTHPHFGEVPVIRKRYWHTWFRGQRIRNLLSGDPWWEGFKSSNRGLLTDPLWSHDARVAFKEETGPSLATVVHAAVDHLLRSKSSLHRKRDNQKTSELWKRLILEEHTQILGMSSSQYLQRLLPHVPSDGGMFFQDSRAKEIQAIALLALSASL